MSIAQPSIRRLQPYRCTRADIRVGRALKLARGSMCEDCGHALPPEQLSMHHIFETRIHPEFAREPLNMLVLCSRCHSSVTASEGFAASVVMHFYSALPAPVRERHLPFVSCHASDALCSAFRSGDTYFWGGPCSR